MRLKEIKPGMAILCESKEQGDAVKEQLLKQGASWNGNHNVQYSDIDRICHLNREGQYNFYSAYTATTGFSDLIIPELTPVEVLKICNEICKSVGPCDNCKMAGNCFAEKGSDYQKVVEICEQWKVDHEKKEPEKKEPEVEWVFDCFQNSNINSAIPAIVVEKEEEAKKHCEDMAKKYPGETFAYISVCRVKQ